MITRIFSGRVPGRLLSLILLLSVLVFLPAAQGAPEDYRFTAVSSGLKVANGAVIAVKLIHAATNQPVEKAVIFRTRLEMTGMTDMEVKATPLPGAEPGVYRFQADLSHEGEWLLTLSAKIPGESATVVGKVSIVVGK